MLTNISIYKFIIPLYYFLYYSMLLRVLSLESLATCMIIILCCKYNSTYYILGTIKKLITFYNCLKLLFMIGISVKFFMLLLLISNY